MPKIKPLDNGNTVLRAIISKNMTLQGFQHNKELAPRMRMHEQTLNYKIKDPGKFTLKELRLLSQVLRFTEEDKQLILR